jgi:hypothetical protein
MIFHSQKFSFAFIFDIVVTNYILFRCYCYIIQLWNKLWRYLLRVFNVICIIRHFLLSDRPSVQFRLDNRGLTVLLFFLSINFFVSYMCNYNEVSEVPTSVAMKSTIFWDITPCSPLKVNRCFGGTYRPRLHGRRISRARNQQKQTEAWQSPKWEPELQNIEIFFQNYGLSILRVAAWPALRSFLNVILLTILGYLYNWRHFSSCNILNWAVFCYVKLCLELINEAPRQEEVCGREGIAPPFLISALDRGEWSASRPGCFPKEKQPPILTL